MNTNPTIVGRFGTGAVVVEGCGPNFYVCNFGIVTPKLQGQTMNLNLDIALCIGGPCPKKTKCARWVVYDNMARAEQRGEIEFNPSVVITTPPFNYNDECFYYMPSELSNG